LPGVDVEYFRKLWSKIHNGSPKVFLDALIVAIAEDQGQTIDARVLAMF
jgi:hypothetical protein